MTPAIQVQTETLTSSKPLFPFLDLRAQFASIRNEVMAAVEGVFEAQHFILGPEVKQFEKEVAELIGCRFAIGCASCSDALVLALMALNIGAGDEVITTPFTFGATAGAIARVGARPVFVDITSETYNLDPASIESAITPRTKAIMPVHLFGLPAPMEEIAEIAALHDLAVIEDAAQAIGASYHGKMVGNIGDIGCFSFFPSKNLGGAGDGGILTTNDPELADRLQVLRVHGSRKKYQYELLGFNSRLDALQASVLRVKLRHLKEWTSARRLHAMEYRILFAQADLADSIHVPSGLIPQVRHVYNQFVIRVQRRDQLREHLQRHGIPTEIYYPIPLHLQPAFSYLGYQLGEFPLSEAASCEVLALPIFPELTEAQQLAVVAEISEFFRGTE